MTVKGMLVFVLRDIGCGDSTADGFTSRVNRCLLIDEHAPEMAVLEAKEGDEVLVVDYLRGYSYPYLTTIAVPAVVKDGKVIQQEKGRVRQFGGNFITSSDSRFAKRHKDVLPVHDRLEGQQAERPGGPGWVKFEELKPGEFCLFVRRGVRTRLMKIHEQAVVAPVPADVNAITKDGRPFYVLSQDLVLRQASF